MRLALAAAGAALLLPPHSASACNEAALAHDRSSVMLMTGLPLVWGEKGPFDPASRPAAAYLELGRDFAFQPVDVLDPESLAKGRLLLLAQPQRLAPAEMVALDGWIRSGGRALILTDPLLTWPSELPLGDIRRPPSVGLLAPLLGHWRVTMVAPARAGEVRARWNGRRLQLDSPGRLRSSSADCVADEEAWTAFCRLGRGTVRLVADADLLRDSLWATADNGAAVHAWLDELAGVPTPRPDPVTGRAWPVFALALAAALAGIALLLRRRRAR